MQTIFVSGNDTGVGKTKFVAALAREYVSRGTRIQIIKPIETGVLNNKGIDAPEAARAAGLPPENARTLFTFPEPIAPIDAAAKEGLTLTLDLLLSAYTEIIQTEVRLVEGAGGLAVPIGQNNEDWAEFISRIPVDIVLLVIEDRLGAINQARMLSHYAKSKNLDFALILNEVEKQDGTVRESNLRALQNDDAALIGRLGHKQDNIEWLDDDRSFLNTLRIPRRDGCRAVAKTAPGRP